MRATSAATSVRQQVRLTAREDHEVSRPLVVRGWGTGGCCGSPTCGPRRAPRGSPSGISCSRSRASPCRPRAPYPSSSGSARRNRPLTMRMFRCAHCAGGGCVPPAMLLSGYLQKKSRSGGTFRPWGERLVEIRADEEGEARVLDDGGRGRAGRPHHLPPQRVRGAPQPHAGRPRLQLQSGRRPAVGWVPPLVSSTTSGESLALAALSAQESAQWIKAI